MIKRVEQYIVTCDCCGAVLSMDDIELCFDSDIQAKESAIESGWHGDYYDKWTCADCADNSEE